MTEKIQQDRPPLIANGIEPISPVFFFDIDDNYDLDDIHSFCNKHVHSAYDIYRTGDHGHHLAVECTNYAEVQHLLDLTKIEFPESDYFRHIDQLRIRISPKWDYITGSVVSPEPTLLECHCINRMHEEKRIGNLVMYGTSK